MPGELDIEKIRWKSFYGFDQDGLNELAYGVLALLISPFILLCFWSKAYSILLVIYAIVISLSFKKIFNSVRKWIHAPRTGYATLKDVPIKTKMLFGLFNAGLMVGVYLIGFSLGINDPVQTLMPVWFGLILCGPCVYHFLKSGSRFFLWYGAAAVAAGVVSTISGHDILDRTLFLTLITGLFYTAAGAIRLRLFLRRHPKVAAEITDDDR